MSRPDQVVVHKDKGLRVFNVVMHLLPTASVGPMAVARGLYGPLNPATYLTLALMGAGTLLPATGTLAELKEKLSSRGKQGVLTLSNLAMLSAVGLMMFGTIPALKESDPAKIAFSGMVLFGLASLLEIPYRAARALNLIGSKLPLELAAVASACVGSCLFLAAQVVAYAQARRTNNQDQMNTAILFALTSLGFIASTGYGAVQIFKAMKGNAVNPESTHAEVREEEGTTPTAPRLPKASGFNFGVRAAGSTDDPQQRPLLSPMALP